DGTLRHAQPDDGRADIHVADALLISLVDQADVVDGLVKGLLGITYTVFAKGIYHLAQSLVAGYADDLIRPGISIPMGENLRQVTTTHCAKPMDAYRGIICRVGKWLRQLGRTHN